MSADAPASQDQPALLHAETLLASGNLEEARAALAGLPPEVMHTPRAYALRHSLRPSVLPGLAAPVPPTEARRIEAALNSNQPEAALTMARTLAARLPHAAMPWRAQALACLALHRYSEACDAASEALLRSPDQPQLYADLARALYELGEVEALRAPAEAAVAGLPDDPQAVRLAAVAAHIHGDRSTARRHFAHLAKLQPNNGAAHRALSELTRYSDRKDAHVTKMLKQVKSGKLTPFEELEFHFALGKAYGDLNRPRDAFRHYARGNALKKSAYGLSVVRYREECTRLHAPFDAPPAIKARIVPILIVGLPRSGTTLAETLLSAHSQVGTVGECPYLRQHLLPALINGTTPEALAKVRDGYLTTLAKADAPFVVDKMPLNFPMIGALHSLLPETRIIAMRRDPMALGWSLYRQCFVKAGNGFAYDLKDIAEAQRLYIDTLDHWRIAGVPVRDLSYTALTEAPEPTLRTMLDDLGLPWEDACLTTARKNRAVATASSLQVRDGIYTGSDADWQPYAKYLEPLRNSLTDLKLL
ncbi:sulfotransferase [Sagittula sp. S175]|uniref:sulfotransferase family protein n=1 Tax=Sagittula sp. S175 TaxID=3415129 RepID=UPI003C7A7160